MKRRRHNLGARRPACGHTRRSSRPPHRLDCAGGPSATHGGRKDTRLARRPEQNRCKDMKMHMGRGLPPRHLRPLRAGRRHQSPRAAGSAFVARLVSGTLMAVSASRVIRLLTLNCENARSHGKGVYYSVGAIPCGCPLFGNQIGQSKHRVSTSGALA